MNDSSILIRKICQEDIEGLALLYDRVWPEQSGDHLKKTMWAVSTSDYKGICALNRDRIIGSRSCFHSNLFLENKRIKSVQFGDSCVDASYRRYGLFTEMNKIFLDDFFHDGDDKGVIYNISVDASRKAYERLGWVYLKSLSNLFYFPYPFRTVVKTKGKMSLLSGQLQSDYAPIPNLDNIPEHFLKRREEILVSKELIHNRYDKETLKWRLGSDSSIRLLNIPNVGACLYKVGNKNNLRFCIIGEVFLYEYTRQCFNTLFGVLQNTDSYDVISVSITHAHPLYKLFRRKGFLVNPKKPFLNLGVKCMPGAMSEVFLNPRKWALSELDIDTF